MKELLKEHNMNKRCNEYIGSVFIKLREREIFSKKTVLLEFKSI